MKANDAEALGRTVADDAMFLPPNEPAVSGRQGVVAWMDAVNKQARATHISMSGREGNVSQAARPMPVRQSQALPG